MWTSIRNETKKNVIFVRNGWITPPRVFSAIACSTVHTSRCWISTQSLKHSSSLTLCRSHHFHKTQSLFFCYNFYPSLDVFCWCCCWASGFVQTHSIWVCLCIECKSGLIFNAYWRCVILLRRKFASAATRWTNQWQRKKMSLLTEQIYMDEYRTLVTASQRKFATEKNWMRVPPERQIRERDFKTYTPTTNSSRELKPGKKALWQNKPQFKWNLNLKQQQKSRNNNSVVKHWHKLWLKWGKGSRDTLNCTWL